MARSIAILQLSREIDNQRLYDIVTIQSSPIEYHLSCVSSPYDMTTRAKITTTALLLVGLAGIGVADYEFAGREYAAELLTTTAQPDPDESGIAKADEVDVETALSTLSLTLSPSEELTFLAQVSRDIPASSRVLLQNGDRIGSVSWIDGDAKTSFITLKEALLSAFSSDVQNLSDTTQQKAGQPTLNILTFNDPALSEETLTFIRIRERLYEFHTKKGAETTMQTVIDTLTTR